LPQALHGGKPPGLVLTLGRDLERSAEGASRLTVAMQGEERFGGSEEHRSGPTGFPSGHPMLGDRPRRRPQSLKAFAQQTMVVSPSRPWNIPIYRLANQVMAKGCGSVQRLDKESRLDQLLEVIVIHKVAEHIRIGVSPRRRGELQSPPGPLRDPIGQEEDRVADRLRERHVLRRTEIHDVALVSKSSGGCQGGRELLDEKRKALGALVDGSRQGPSGNLSEDASHQLRCVRRVEGVELHLPESVRSP